MALCTNAYNSDIKHNPQMISGGRQDLVLKTKVANMEIKIGNHEGKKAVTTETKAVIMQGKEEKPITKEAISMIQEGTSMV
eukprot:1577633-Ditylum_brightwellii.AAC.1